MKIDISTIDEVIRQSNAGPVHVKLIFKNQFMYVDVQGDDLNLPRRIGFSYESLIATDMTLQELVNAIVSDYINDTNSAFEQFLDKYAD